MYNDSIIIGVTGSYGKTSCAYSIQNYIKLLGYECAVLSSHYLDTGVKINNRWNNHLREKGELEYYLYQSKNCDYIIIEVNENSLRDGVYDNLQFDYKVITNLNVNFNQHSENNEYYSLKYNFIKSQDCCKIINIDSFNNYDLQNILGTKIFYTTNIANSNCDIYPLEYKNGFYKSNYTFSIYDEVVSISGKLNNSMYNNLITVAATAYAMDMWDGDLFSNLYVEENVVPGRYEVHNIKSRNVVIDSGNGKALEQFSYEMTDINVNKFKGLINVVGGLNDATYQVLTTGVAKPKLFLDSDPILRKNCVVFGAHLYNAIFRLSQCPDKFAFNEVIEEFGSEVFGDVTPYNFVVPNRLVDQMIAITQQFGEDDSTKSIGFAKAFWWRSIPAIKTYFTSHYYELCQIYDQFIHYNIPSLKEATVYVKEMIDYLRLQEEKETTTTKFVSLNKYIVSNPEVRKNCLIFGAHLYKTIHKLAELPNDFVFNEVKEEIGEENLIDISTQQFVMDDDFLENIITMAEKIGDTENSRTRRFAELFWWRSIPLFKSYFTIHYDQFCQIYNQFMSYNILVLSRATHYVKEMVDYTRSCYRKLGDSLSKLPIKKIYLTMNNSNSWNDEIELQMHQAFFVQPTDIYTDRREALQAIASESEHDDILFVAGRGSSEAYRTKTGTIYFDDYNYLKECFAKGDENEKYNG